MTNLKERNNQKDKAKSKKIKKILDESLENGLLDNGLIVKGYFSANGLEDNYYFKDDGKLNFLFVVWKSEKEAWRVVEEFIESHQIKVYEG